MIFRAISPRLPFQLQGDHDVRNARQERLGQPELEGLAIAPEEGIPSARRSAEEGRRDQRELAPALPFLDDSGEEPRVSRLVPSVGEEGHVREVQGDGQAFQLRPRSVAQ